MRIAEEFLGQLKLFLPVVPGVPKARREDADPYERRLERDVLCFSDELSEGE